MADPVSRFILRGISVLILLGVGVALVVANRSDAGDGASPTPIRSSLEPSPSVSIPGSPSAPGSPEECEAAGRTLAEIDFAIRETWRTHHGRARALERPTDKAQVYRSAARYFGVLDERLREINPPTVLQPIQTLLFQAVDTSTRAATRLATAFGRGDEDAYAQAVDLLRQASSYHDAADGQLRNVDCGSPAG